MNQRNKIDDSPPSTSVSRDSNAKENQRDHSMGSQQAFTQVTMKVLMFIMEQSYLKAMQV